MRISTHKYVSDYAGFSKHEYCKLKTEVATEQSAVYNSGDLIFYLFQLIPLQMALSKLLLLVLLLLLLF